MDHACENCNLEFMVELPERTWVQFAGQATRMLRMTTGRNVVYSGHRDDLRPECPECGVVGPAIDEPEESKKTKKKAPKKTKRKAR